MTASGSHKKRSSKRSSALSCFFLKTLQSASRSCDGLRFSSLLHKERSRMAKGMSPLRLFMRNPPRKTVPDNVDGGSSGVDATIAASQSRQPLVPITITETVGNPPIPVAEQSSGEPSTPRTKSKMSSQGQEKFPHLENSERHAASVNVTPDRTANLHSKGKFTWQHRHGPVAQSTTREGPPDLSTPPRPSKGSVPSDGQATALSANNQDTSQTLRGCSTGGGSVQITPKGGRSVGSKAANELENCGSQSQNSTPCKSVSRSLKYGQQGSASNSGASGITNVRSAVSQHLITRPMGYLQAVKGGAPQTMNHNFVEHHFELEEDASFWCDHNVQVIIRTRPISNSELAAQGSNRCLKQESPHTVSWLGQPESRFTFDHVAGETVTQAKLFDVAGLPMVENCMSGYNSCMFAYGQTGSGKTHTMLGDIEHLDRSPSENRGMTPRVFEYLFGRIRKEQECRRQEHLKFFCKCSFLEIYNEQITDLLEPSSTNLQMREDAKKGVYVENLSEVEVQCVQDVIQLLLQGAANRKVAATNMNRESSRSHSVFTCVVESKWENNSMTNSRYGRLHLVDLAGSERQKSSGAEGGRLKEAANINKSLSTLGLVIMILVDVANGKQRHVPYRDSKLTFLLQDSLGGNSKTIMIANVSPSSCCAMETLSTLKFAQRAKFIRNNAVINEDASGDVIALRQRIEELKGEVDRLRRESVLRISSSRVLALENSSSAGQPSGDKLNAPTVNCPATEGCASDSINANKAQITSTANNDQHLRSMEAVLAGALRREQLAEDITKKLAAEIEQLNRLVRQREEDSQCSKMMLRFREEKIRRLEGIADNVLSAESFFADEKKNLIEELQLIRARLDRNPELTRFAMENIRLMEELRRYQEFYDGGERDVLLEEISGLRSQLLDKLDIKLGEEQTMGELSTPQKRALAPELSALGRENELLLVEVKSYQNELKECRNNLNSCLVANADLARQVDDLQATVKELQSELSERHEEPKEVPNLDPQETALSANPTSTPIPLETEEVASQQRQALANFEAQVLELKKKLQDAQDLIWKLSSEVAPAKITSEEADLHSKHIADGGQVNESVVCVADDDAVAREGIQDRWEKLQEIEMRHAEEITRLQLELDIMEDVVKEERQQRSIAEQKNDDLSGQLSAAVFQLEQEQARVEDGLEEEKEQRLLSEQKCEELSGQLSAAVSELHQAQCLVEELEGQQLFSISELEDLQSEHTKLLGKLKQKEEEESELRKQFQDESNLDDPAVAILEQKLLRARRGKEEAKRMTRQFQEEKAARIALEKEREATMSEVETQAALAITTLQSEILELREEASLALESEAAAKLRIARLQKEVETLQETTGRLEDDNRLLSNTSDRYRNLVDEKNAQLRAVEAQWESATSKLIDYLGDGDKTLTEAAKVLDEINQGKVQDVSQMDDHDIVQNRDGPASFCHHLQDVQLMVRETEGQVRALGDAVASGGETTGLKFEDGEAMIRESEKKSMVAFLMVREVLETIKDLKSAQQRLVEENQQAYSKEVARDLESAALQQQLADLHRKFGELNDKHELVVRNHEDLREEYEKSSLELGTASELQVKNVRLEEEIQESRRALAEKDEENGNLHKQLDEIETQSTLIAGRYQLLMAAHDNLKQEQARHLEDQTLKAEEGEHLIRLSERKAMAVLVMVEQLLGSKNELKAINTGLAKEIEDGRLLLAEKQAALATLQQQLEEDTHHYKEIADQYQLLAVTHTDLQEEHERLLAEKALRVEKGEAMERFSERKAMAAFVVLGELLEKMKELKAANSSLAKQIQDEHLALAEKDSLVASLRNDLSECKGIALKAEEGEQLIRLSERKAMAVLVMVEQLLSSRNELKVANMGLTKEIEDGRLLLAEKQAAVAILQQQLEDAHHHKEIADQYQLLAETHGDLKQQHESLLAEKALIVEEGEAMVRFSERKAMAAFVVLEELLEKMKELKAANSSGAKQIQDAHLALAERDTVLASLQNDLFEYSDVARRHQVLTGAHENLIQDHERLVQENVLTAEDGERAIKLSERKAMAALVALSQIVDGKTGLKAKAESLEKDIEEAHAALAKNITELVAVQQKLEQRDDEAMDVANQQQVLMAVHDTLREEHDRSQEELNKTREGHERLQEELHKARERHERLQEELAKAREEHESLQAELEQAREDHVRLQAAVDEAQDKYEMFLRDNALSIQDRERMIKVSEKKAMGSFVVAEHLVETLKVLKVTQRKLEKEIEESRSVLSEKDARLAVVQLQLEESHRDHKEVFEGHQVLAGKYKNLKEEYDMCLVETGHLQEQVEMLELDLKAYRAQVRVLQDLSVAAERQCSEVWTKALKAHSFDDMKIGEAIEFMTSVRDGLDGMCHDLSCVEVAVDQSSSLERELSTCLSKVLMLEEENGGNMSARESLQKEISRLATSLQLKERGLQFETALSKSWEEERVALVSEKELSRRDCLEQEEMVQSLLLEVQTLDSTLKDREVRVSDMLTGVQVLIDEKSELELEKSRLVLAARQAETNCSKKELEISAMQGHLAAVQARLSAAELREQSVSSQMEQLTSASVAWEIERAVVENKMEEIRDGKHKLGPYLNDFNLEIGKRELAVLETFKRSEEALEKVAARITAMDQELAGLEESNGNLEHDTAFLESAATDYVFGLEEKELECLELKRQLGIAEVQITEMQSAMDLATAQIAIEKTNREADKRTMEEEIRACKTELRNEIASAELLSSSTEGALRNEVERLESSLNQAEFRLSEMLTAVTALTVAKEELELERSRLVQASSQAEMNCSEKEQELIAIQGDLAGVLARVAEAELREKSTSGQLEELAGAKVEWEVDRAVVKREIEEMRKEKDQLRIELDYLNAEVEERELAIFESFRRSQEALEMVEMRLTTMDRELPGQGAVEENLEHSIALLESASTIAMVASEENEHNCLEMERRVQNAEVQMFEMKTATDLDIARFMLDRENWEVEKRRMKLDKDIRETELRDEIAAAQLKLVATEGSLKTAVENVEALGFRKIALEEEVRKLHDDAKISLLKVTEQQQEVNSLRDMSRAFKAERKEADDSIAALNQLREQYILAEANWRSEQGLLMWKLEKLETSAGLQGDKETSDDSTDAGEFSQCEPECIARSEDQLQRQEEDNQVLRTIISEKERTILSAKKELHIAVANCKETEVEMDKVHLENRRLIQTELDNKSLIDALSVKLRTAEDELLKRDRKIEGCEAELLKVARIMSDWETKMEDAESEWRRDKEVLAQELTEAKLVANEKRTEAASILQKFQDGQATLKEAEYLMDALVQANESAKHDALDWKTEKESLGFVQGWWMPERDKLVSEIARLETDMHAQKQDIWIICKEAVIGLLETMDVLSVVEQELHELKNDHHQEFEHLVGEMKVLKDDLASHLQLPEDLRLELAPRSAMSEPKLETMGRMPELSENSHCDREEALKMTLLELEHSRSELASVQVTVCHLQAELKDQSKVLRDYHEKLRSADEVNAELLEKYNQGVMQWEDERDQRETRLMQERLKQNCLGAQLEETRETIHGSLSETGKLQSCLKAAEHSYAKCFSELLALTRAVSAEDLIFEQLQLDLKRLIVDIEEVKDQTLIVLVDELRADHEEMGNITCQMSALRDEVVELGSLSTAIVHGADVTKERQSNRFVQLYRQELEFTREILTGSLTISETLASQLQEISVELEEVISMHGVGTLNLRSDFGAIKVEILNFQKTAEEEVSVWTLRRNMMGEENERLIATVKALQSKNSVLSNELDESRRSIDILEEELLLKKQKIAYSLQMVNSQLKAVERERDRYQTDLVVLNEQLDMAQSLADERDLVAAEARQAAELSKSHAEEKEEEARILERSVEELESTVYALETQLGIVRRESEMHRVEREALEKDLEGLKHQMGLMQLTIDSQEAQTVKGLQDAEASKTELDRMVIEMKNQQVQARKSVESLQQECAEKDVQLRSCKAYIAELVLGAEKQASENQQKLKALEAMVEHLKVEERKVTPSGGSASKGGEKSTGKVKGGGSPFKCIGSGLEKQRSSEMDEELSAAKKRIKELEAVAASRQKEVFMLNTKLAEAESMTHDVIRDLLGVKVDIASYASLLNQQQVQRIAERARRRTAEAQQKEEELDTLRGRLNEFIEERESWLEEINRRQAEAVAARVSAEKLRLRDQTLTTENETFREDCLMLRKKVTELEDEIKKLSGQQNLQQRIHHHAKIKEENNAIRLQNEDLSGKLRRMEILFTRVNDELARYRTADGKSAFLNFDEEARLQKKLQETEENRLQLAETLIGLCTGIMQAAGIQRTSRDLDPSAAITVLQQLQDRQESLERELSDYKLKARIAVERRRLSDLRDFHTPVKTTGANTNFTASQQLPSPVSSSR